MKGTADRIEIETRYCLSRAGKLRLEGSLLKFPAVLYHAEDAQSMPSVFEYLLTDRPSSDGRVQFIAPVNALFGNGEGGISGSKVVMPAFIPFSSLLEGIEKLGQQKGDIEYLLGQGEKVVSGDTHATLFILANAAELYQDPFRLASTLVSFRRKVGNARLLYLPGIATPANLALLIYGGGDIFDSVETDLLSAAGRFFSEGRELVGKPEERVCGCSACERDDNAEHNRLQLLYELNRCGHALRHGYFREYVEARAAGDIWCFQFLRYMDTVFYSDIERFAPNGQIKIRAIGEFGFHRAEVRRFSERLQERYAPPPLPVMLLVPCSRKKPYFLSRSHRTFGEVIRNSPFPSSVHIVTVTSPLGIVPEELEIVFPAAHYDIPVTGHWGGDEVRRSTELLLELVRRGRYKCIISHLEDEREFMNSALRQAGYDVIDTSQGRTRSRDSLERLSVALASHQYRTDRRERLEAFMRNIALFQFGKEASCFTEHSEFMGRYPNIRIVRSGIQKGMLNESRGGISLTLSGGELLNTLTHSFDVEMENFKLKGNLFAQGVREAGEGIRIGDEAVVVQDGNVVAVGVAMMSAAEMNAGSKGEAVHVRHNAP